ncbi:MAG: hypothetical protein BGN88_04365 [Clostridiales bacterium 43-6]|nr:MAG: hypothetical protein BGN88_04365 [Clostridiales bacterium 43-6]
MMDKWRGVGVLVPIGEMTDLISGLASISKTDFEDSLYKSKLHSSTLFARSDHFLMVKAPPFLGFELIQILEIECKNETYYLMFI